MEIKSEPSWASEEVLLDEDFIFEETTELDSDETYDEALFGECKDDPKNDDYDPEDHEAFRMDYIPLDYKVRVLALVEAHPTWSLETLRKSGARRLKRKEYLAQWEKDVQTGGTRYDKLHKIDIDTFERFKKARASGQHVTKKTLQQWAMAIALPFLSETFEFKASRKWARRFTKEHRIK